MSGTRSAAGRPVVVEVEPAGSASPTTGAVRVVRAGLLGGLSLLLAVGAHTVGGGQLPAAGVLLVSAVLLGLGAAVLTRKRCGLPLLVPLLLVQQVLLHELFSVAAAAGSCTSSVAVAGHGGHVASMCVGAGGTGMAMAGPSWLMWPAHLLATVATAWLLACGEAWLWRAVDRVGVAAGLGSTIGAPTRRQARVQVALVLLVWTTATWAPAGPRGPPAAAAG